MGLLLSLVSLDLSESLLIPKSLLNLLVEEGLRTRGREKMEKVLHDPRKQRSSEKSSTIISYLCLSLVRHLRKRSYSILDDRFFISFFSVRVTCKTMARYLQFSTVFFVVLVAFSALILESYFAPKNLTLGYLLLFSSDREAQLNYWKKNVKFDTDIIHPPIPVPEILAKGIM